MIKVQLIRTVKRYSDNNIIKLGNINGLGIRADKKFNSRSKRLEFVIKGTLIKDYKDEFIELDKNKTISLIFREEDINALDKLLEGKVEILIDNDYINLKLPNTKVLLGITKYRFRDGLLINNIKDVVNLNPSDEDYSLFLLEKRIESFNYH
jgi:hypothetical protein